MSPAHWIRRLFLRPSRAPFTHPRKQKVRLWLETLEDRSAPAVLTVNTLADTTTDTGHLSLRDAITLVNNGGNQAALNQSLMPAGWASQINTTTNPFGANDTIQFDPGLAGKTIALTTVGDNSFGPSAFLISTPLTIQGLTGNQGITLAGPGAGGNLRLFHVSSGGRPPTP
jgi:hypothetical protein